MRQKMKQLMGILFSIVMIMGMSLTAYADGTTYDPASTYTSFGDLNTNNTEVIISEVPGKTWYVIANDGSTVTLLSKESFASKAFNSSTSLSFDNTYATSEIKTYVEGLTGDGQPLAGIKDALANVSATNPSVTGKVPYLLNTEEAGNLSETKKKGAGTNWWLRSPGSIFFIAAIVYGGDGFVSVDRHIILEEFGVRPALKLNLSSVIFSSPNTFSLKPAGYSVTYKVIGGTWSDGSTTDRKETVKSGAKPATVPTGMKAASGYTGGAWDTDPESATITGAATFTYTFTEIPTYAVTYKVVGGTWSDGSTTDKKETVQSGAKPATVPTGMKAASGYAGGSWNTDPTQTTITGAKTFIYTFTASTYSYTYGDGSTWPKNSSMSLSFRVMNSGDDSKSFDHFKGAKVDGKPLTKDKDFTAYAYSGSVIIELKPVYLETLSVGEHTLTAEFTDGTAEAKFTVAKGEPINLPQTGDSSNVFIHVLVGLLALSGLGLVIKKR